MTYQERARELRPLIEKAVSSLDDTDALASKELYPQWMPGIECAVGARYQYGNLLYKCKIAHTSQSDWTPDVAVSLFDVVSDSSGTEEDVIEYSPGMALEEGKYYSQFGVTYLCFRSTGNAVYHNLADLVGLYVNIAE